MSAICQAAQEGDLERVKGISKSKRFPEETIHANKDRQFPLWYAAEAGHLDVVRWLVSEGVNINERNIDGKTACYIASAKNNLAVVEFLTASGADVTILNKNNQSPLYVAAANGYLEIVRTLCQSAEDVVDYIQGRTYTAKSTISTDTVLICLRNRHYHVFLLLVDLVGQVSSKGALNILLYSVDYICSLSKSYIRDWKTEISPSVMSDLLYQAIYLDETTTLVNLRKLGYFTKKNYQTGMSAEERDNQFTPLTYAVHHNKQKSLKTLVEIGISLDKSQSRSIGSPIWYMAILGKLDMVKYLIENYHVDVNFRHRDGSTPIIVAAEKGHWDIVKYLHEHGADIFATDNTGRSPLYFAVWNGTLPEVKYLHELGADLHQLTITGESLLQVAERKRRRQVRDYLKNIGQHRQREAAQRRVQEQHTAVLRQFPKDAEGDAIIPEEYTCPITQTLMLYPVVAMDGFTYEQNSIQEWIGNKTEWISPKTNQLTSGDELIANRLLKLMIINGCSDPRE